MEPNVRQPRLFEKRLERARGKVAEVQGLAGSCGEDEVIVFPEASCLEPFDILGRPVGLERFDGPPREFYAAALPILWGGEGRAGPSLGSGAPYTQGRCIRVYVFPLEAQEFSHPEP